MQNRPQIADQKICVIIRAMRPKCKRHAPLREKNAGRHAAAGKFHVCQCSWIIMRIIVRSVSRMPSLASVPMLRIVFSTPLTTIPSPP